MASMRRAHVRARWLLSMAVVAGVGAEGRYAAAQGAPPKELSPEELAEIQRALGADKAALPAPPPPGLPAPPAPIARAVASMNPSLSFIADFALAAFSSKNDLQAGGHDPTVNG